MNELHYLDNASTTRVSAGAAAAVLYAMETAYGNPSSVHKMGIEAEGLVETARERVAKALGCAGDEIYFTSGGTEADNFALIRGAESLARKGRHIITTSAEHPAVLNTAKYLETKGFEVNYLRSTRTGSISLEELESLIRPDTALLSMMLINNETGTLLPVDKAAKLFKEKNPEGLVHTDAVQAFMKYKFTPAELGADMLSLSSHKIHGPKGVGALYIKKGVNLPPYMFGGGQQKGMRPGTEAVGGISGFGVAAQEAAGGMDMNIGLIGQLRGRLLEGLEKLSGVTVIAAGNSIVNFSVPKYPSEVLIRMLESRNIYVSSGSACAKGKDSHVLDAMHIDKRLIRSAVRVSFSSQNDAGDVDALLSAIEEIIL
ncbi:MAG: cysteine desulfurase [Oscillospiraceae bacterium]|jgi:cysteine desulfurase|nr:cysteine desulfurase [Oscillospiraceae bacterium]